MRRVRPGRWAPIVKRPSGLDAAFVLDFAIRDADLMRLGSEHSMLDERQAAVVYMLTRLCCGPGARVAELGSYVGGTTSLLGAALRRSGAEARCLEVYDLFEHNSASRKRLAGHSRFDPDSFLPIWEHNVAEVRELVELCVGDLRVTAQGRREPLDLLYVDIVKHPAVIAPVVQHFLSRLRPGGLLLHQDYFHWQSPWVVTSTERLIDYFRIVGAVSNHMLVLELERAIPADLLAVDDAQLPRSAQESLMRAAISRQSGIRAGLLRVSRLNLMMGAEGFAFESEADSIRDEFGVQQSSRRVIRYLDEVIRLRAESGGRPTW